LIIFSALILSGCANVYVPPPRQIDATTTKIALESLTFPERQFLTPSKFGDPAVIWAELRLPRGGAERVPAVVLAHGCGGLSPTPSGWGAEFLRAGYAIFVVDSFGGRGIQNTCAGRERINMGSRVADAYRALEFLARHPRVDPERIAFVGFSQGGGVALLARQTRLQRLWLKDANDFAAYVAFYPAVCNRRFVDEERVSERPLRILHGAADDWTPIGPCREYADRMQRMGKNVTLFEYPDAHHGFDNPNLPPTSFRPQVLNARACLFTEQPDGRFTAVHKDTGARASPDSPCVTRGATIGYNARAREKSVQDVKLFLATVFKTNPS
jgi:dienelactone hydrolase